MRKFISIASSKGGIGKSTTALGLSYAFSDGGKTVLLCDLDYGNACLDMLCGCEDRVLYTSADAASGICKPFDAVIKPYDGRSLYFLPAPTAGAAVITDGGLSQADSERTPVSASDLKRVIEQAAENTDADIVIIDTGAGTNKGTALAASLCQTALVVASHSPVSLRSAEGTAARLLSLGLEDSRLIINSFDADGVLGRKGLGRSSIFKIIDTCRVPLCGIVPYDYSLSVHQEGVGQKAGNIGASAYKNIAARLLGDNVPLFTGIKRHRKIRNKFYK